jgi:class 3 adenylate cyclase
MVCQSCGQATKADARFCGGCGAPFASPRPACCVETEPDARFCGGCGATLSPRPADVGGARKVVTIVFADLAGSTALHERLDAESTRAIALEGYSGNAT